MKDNHNFTATQVLQQQACTHSNTTIGSKKGFEFCNDCRLVRDKYQKWIRGEVFYSDGTRS